MKKRFYCRRDDLRIVGTEFLPDVGFAPFPTIIISHEFMTTRKSTYKYAEDLSKAGYAVFTFDFCGGSKRSASEGSTENMSILTEVADLRTVYKYVDSLDYVDSNKIVLMGCSQGGFVSALLAAELDKEIAALVLLYPAFSLVNDVQRGQVLDAEFNPNSIPEEIFLNNITIGRKYALDAMYMEPFAVIGGYQGKVLIIHGDADELVDLKWSRLAQAAYVKGGADVELKPIPNAGHIFNKSTYRNGAIAATLVFLDCKLGLHFVN